MMASHHLNRSKANSLVSQIRDAERQVLNRKRSLDMCADSLALNIQQQMTAPATLLLASGAGFIIGEFTRCQPGKIRSIGDEPSSPETSPLRLALNLLASIQTLYTALPIVWMMKAFYQPDSSRRPSKQHSGGDIRSG
jgi:hypothetical protein